MLDNERELRHAYETMTRLYQVRDKCAVEPAWDEENRAQVVAGIEAQMRKVEREIAEYLGEHPHAKAA